MRKLGIIAVLSLMALAIAAVPAFAGRPHFIKNATSASLSGSNLVVNFKEAGLPSGSTEYIQSSATATTTYECVNGGGKNPSASNKTTVTDVSTPPEPFTADRNGNVSGNQTLSPPSAQQLGFSCPPGQRTTFVGVSYSNVMVNDLTSGASYSIPGTFTYTNPSAP